MLELVRPISVSRALFSIVRRMFGIRIDLVLVAVLVILGVQLALGSLDRKSWRRLQIQRRVQHVLSGAVVLYFQRTFRAVDFVAFLIVSMVSILAVHSARQYLPSVQRLFSSVFRNILRKSETKGKRMPGALYFLLGDLISFLLYPPQFCSLAILAVTVGDAAAGLIGASFQSRSIFGGKTLFGTLACGIFSALFLTLAALSWGVFDSSLSAIEVAIVAFLFGVTAASAELFAVVDDNLTLPIFFRLFWVILAYAGLPIAVTVASA